MRVCLTMLFLLLVSWVNAQSTIKGLVYSDLDQPMPYASVVLLDSDSISTVAYTLAGEDGSYVFNSVKQNKIYWIRAQALGYNIQKEKTSLSAGTTSTTINFKLEKSSYTLKEVVVKSNYRGISFDGDTIAYDPKRFTDGSEVSLGDLLNKMPGIEVDQNGGVKVQGQFIDKVLLNGQEFFSNNTQMATRNLSADIVDKVQVLKNYTDYSQLKHFQSGQKTVINIDVNKDKLKKITGTVQAGGGVDDKYTSRISLIKLMPKMMISYIGASNNVGEVTLSFEDYIKLQGGITEVLGADFSGGSPVVNLSQEETNMLRPKNNTYTNTRNLSALNLSYNSTPKFKLNSYILYSGEITKSQDLVKDTYLIDGRPSFYNTKQLYNKGHMNMPSGYVNATYNISQTATLNYKGSVSNLNSNQKNYISEEYSAQRLLTDDNKHANGWSVAQNISFIKSFGKHVLTANLIYNNRNSWSEYNFRSDSLLLPLNLTETDGWYYAKQDVRERTTNAQLDVSLLYYVNNSYFLKAGVTPRTTKKVYETNIYQDITKQLADKELLNDYSFVVNNYASYISFLKNSGLFRFKLGLVASEYTFSPKSMIDVDDESLFKLQPDLELSLYFTQKHSLKLSYNQSYMPMSASSYVSNLVFSQYDSYSQKSDIKRIIYRNEDLRLQYNLYDMFSNTMIYVVGGINNMYHPESYRFHQDGLLTVQNPTLSPKAKNWYANIYINKGMGFIPWRVEVNSDYQDNKSINYATNLKNEIKNRNYNGKLNLRSRFINQFNFDFNYQFKFLEDYIVAQDKNLQRVHTVGAKVKFNNKKKIKSFVELKYLSNTTSSSYKNQWELNTSLRYQLTKKLELELSGANILNIKNNDWLESSFNGIYFAERSFGRIPGNIMFSFNYKIM